MSLFSKLFGGGGGGSAAPEAKSEDYNGFTITPTPISEGQEYRVSARIEKQVGDEVKTHTLIRADTMSDGDAANKASVAKAKQMIDEQGERLFG